MHELLAVYHRHQMKVSQQKTCNNCINENGNQKVKTALEGQSNELSEPVTLLCVNHFKRELLGFFTSSELLSETTLLEHT